MNAQIEKQEEIAKVSVSPIGNGSEYDLLYGMDLDEYCKAHGVTVAQLVKKTEIDIEILNKRFGKLYTDIVLCPLGRRVYTALQKKMLHRDRLQEWGYAESLAVAKKNGRFLESTLSLGLKIKNKLRSGLCRNKRR